ncbi:MAG: sugar ABC transporter permease [Clostridia bacterium]|nr:sugar ABC transporter permease [Clostridia bacterium]
MRNFRAKVKRDRYVGLIALPGFLYLLIFNCVPMAGIIVAFQNFSFRKSIFQNKWVGLKWFTKFFHSIYFTRVVRNTLVLNALVLFSGMLFSILLALFLNEFKNQRLKKFCQSATYFPHFVSVVVLVGIMTRMFDTTTGVVNTAIAALGGSKVDFFNSNVWIRPLYVASSVWSGAGWGSIIYMGAITAVDPTLYEAAMIDGCDRFKQMLHITLPSVKPVIITVLIMNIGKMMNLGATKVLLMYNAATYETMDVISTFVYRTGITQGEYGYATAIGLFNSVVNILLLVTANYISKKTTEVGVF